MAATFAPGFLEITAGAIASEEEALAEVAAMGWNAFASDVTIQNDEELHWHDFESVVFIVSGKLRIADEHGVVSVYERGSRIRSGERILHRELVGDGYRAVFGFKIKPSEFTQPLNKPVSML